MTAAGHTRAMSATSVDLLAPVHRLTVAQYMRMGELGLFDQGPRVELIDGVVVEMSPIGPLHRLHMIWLNRHIVRQLGDEAVLSPQQDVIFEELRSAPQPDVAVLPAAGRVDFAAPLLVIEVADWSLAYDRVTKARLYARHGVTDYWIVDVNEEAVEVHRGPSPDGRWATRSTHRAGDTLRTPGAPEVEVRLAELFAYVRENAADAAD